MFATCRPSRTLPLALSLLALAAALLGLPLTPDARAAADFGAPVPGRHIYDRAGLLTTAEIADLEARARAVEAAGAPVVVYLRARAGATESETEQDARDLMDAWDVQSAPGARDGVVMFFNLEPDDLRRGAGFVLAGEAHYQDGNLPRRELERIFNDVMVPRLREDRTAEGIGAGLDAIAHSLAFGPPPPSAFEQAVTALTRGPLSVVNLLAAAIAAGVALLAARAWQARPRSSVPIMATTQLPPERLEPAVAGALARGRVGDEQMEATILALARRGALSLEPTGRARNVQVRLISRDRAETEIEQLVWDTLSVRADDDMVVAHENLSRLQGDWGPVKETLGRRLQEREWFDPNATSRRLPAYLTGGLAIALAVVVVILAATAEQGWPVAGAGLLLAAGLVAIGLGAAIPDTTPLGEAVAVEWRSYREGLRRIGDDPILDARLDLDEAMPYAVAMGATGSLKKRLEAESRAGYLPAWLGPSLHEREFDGGYYPYWTSFHSSLRPASSSSGSSGGGASSGGGGAGGRF